ncbi:MAG: TlpA family protein disulfide reductase [Flavobacteriales bacterium]|nr:TlpA family protein disulfide reductase [Flavobacteriales bacterium]
MRLMRAIFVGLALFISLASFAGEVVIHGKSKGIEGKKISVNFIEDYLSMNTKKVKEGQVDDKGNFNLYFSTEETREIQLRFDGLHSFMYVQPGTEYFVELGPIRPGQNKSFTDNQIELLFDTLQKFDVNNLILDFNERLDAFMAYNMKVLGTKAYQAEVDTFKVYLAKVYHEVKDPYFRDYVFYSIAGIEQIGGIDVDMVKLKAKLYKEYLSQGKVIYNSPAYMLFFQQYYTDVFKLANDEEEKKLVKAINYKKSWKMVDSVLMKDPFLRNDRIRELVMIKGLSEEYYAGQFYPDNIVLILDSIKKFSNYKENSLIAQNLRTKLTQLNVGYPAPAFSLKNEKDLDVSLIDLKGKYVYLQFWATWNNASIGELKIMTELHKKYGEDIRFVSVNMDDSKESWIQFLKEHPEMKWIHLHYSDDAEIIEKYRVSALPLYYLIGPDGLFIQSPAYKPTPNGTFITIENTFFEIYRRLHPRSNPKGQR